MEVIIKTSDGDLGFIATTIEVARLVASAHGFHVDVEPMEPGRVKVTARRLEATIHCSGSSVNDAASKLIGYMVGREPG